MAETTASAPDLLEAKFTTTDAPRGRERLGNGRADSLGSTVTTATFPVSLLMIFFLPK